MKTRFHLKALGLAAGLIGMLVPSARAQVISLSVGNRVPVTNALGRKLPGTSGYPDSSCRVEIRQTWTGGLILAPSNGAAQVDAFNMLVTNSYLGFGKFVSDSGLYAETFEDRSVLDTNRIYYVRVFDRPDPAAAFYYADTLPFSIPPTHVSEINPEFGPLKRVDGEADVDTDGDGIPDALENSEIGTYPSEWDSDRDGFNDWFEAFYAPYMDPIVSNEVDFAVLLNPPGDPETEPYTVSWWTLPVPGMTYLLEYTDGLPFEKEFTVVLETNIATDAYLEVPVDDLIGTNDPVKGFFRVTVPYAGP